MNLKNKKGEITHNIMRLFILSVFFLFSLALIVPIVLSDVVDITIEYETTTTPAGETTTPGGDGGGGGGPGITTIPPEELLPDYSLTYSMPEYFKIYQNETGVFNIEVNNNGQLPLNNIFITISGISSDSYSINPSSINTLEPGHSYSFSVSINPEKLTVGTHTLTITITSDEKEETASMSLDVKAYTKQVAEQMEEQEKFEEINRARTAWWILLVTMIIILAFLLLVNIFFRFKREKRENIQISEG